MTSFARKGKRIDYYCWDLYARTSHWYGEGTAEEQAARKQLRLDTLHLIEHGGNETAEIADLISTAVLRRHLETMLRLGIEYDFLPRESEILHLKFWEAAFEKLKQSGVLYFENEGKNKGCWVMARPGAERQRTTKPTTMPRSLSAPTAPSPTSAKTSPTTSGNSACWAATSATTRSSPIPITSAGSPPSHGEPNHPHFGDATAIYNVIDSRQSDPQSNVIQALRGMGYTSQADHYTHFSYEMVALTPRCAVELGYDVSDEDKKKSYIEVSGRKGFGVKADDLIDKLIAATRAEVDARQTGHDDAERQTIAEQIAIGALRYFMLKYTRNSVIAFDFKDALSFEGETGPYIQYAVVRIRNIFRKGGTSPEAALAGFADVNGARPQSLRRRQRRHLVALAARRPFFPGFGAVHWNIGTGLSRQARLPARAGVRQLLPSPPHPHGRGPRAQDISARHRRGHTARTRRRARASRHRKPRSDVKNSY